MGKIYTLLPQTEVEEKFEKALEKGENINFYSEGKGMEGYKTYNSLFVKDEEGWKESYLEVCDGTIVNSRISITDEVEIRSKFQTLGLSLHQEVAVMRFNLDGDTYVETFGKCYGYHNPAE